GPMRIDEDESHGRADAGLGEQAEAPGRLFGGEYACKVAERDQAMGLALQLAQSLHQTRFLDELGAAEQSDLRIQRIEALAGRLIEEHVQNRRPPQQAVA